MKPNRNIAARAGRWSARHRKTAIIGWFVFVVLAVAVGGAIGTKDLPYAQSSRTGDSGRADRVLETAFKRNYAERVLIQARTGDARQPEFRAGVRDLIERITATGQAVNVRSPYASGNSGQISKDGRSALLTFEVKGTAGDSSGKQVDDVDPLLAATSAAQRANPSLRIEELGDASIQKAVDNSIENDFKKAQRLSLPLTLAILVFAFGALVAAGIPVLIAISSVMATIGLIAIPSQFMAMDSAVAEVILLVGMAVGVDYSLFYLRREREERAAGRSKEAALEAASATSGRSVLVSGLTVMTAMAGMYFTGDRTFESFATGGIIVVAVAVIGSLTVLPALLSKLGDGVMRGRVPFVARRRESGAASRAWSAVLRPVLRRPAIAATLAAAVLLALTVPALGMKTGNPGVNGLPQDIKETKTLKRMEAAFPGGNLPAQVVVQAPDVSSGRVAGAIDALEKRALASGRFRGPAQVDTNAQRTVAVVSLPITGSGTDATSDAALASLRGDMVPATVGKIPGVAANVTGLTAQSKDYNDRMSSRTPIVFAFVLIAAFVLLLVTFRSVVVALKAIVLNLLSVGAAYGVLVMVFQKGMGESIFGFQSTGSIESWLPLFLFVILFGISMDYQVFIVSRIREAVGRGMSTSDAVEYGIKSTAGVVTSAAIVMVAVFGIFASLGVLMLKEMGVGLAVAVLIDATIVRAVLLPATMKLLGDRNWYVPRHMRWLPEVRIEQEQPESAVA